MVKTYFSVRPQQIDHDAVLYSFSCACFDDVILFAVYLACIPLVYLIAMLSLSGVRKLGLKNLRGNLHYRMKKVQRKEEHLVNLVSNTSHAIRLTCKYMLSNVRALCEQSGRVFSKTPTRFKFQLSFMLAVYYPSQTSVDKGFFRPASWTVGLTLSFKNSGHVIIFLRHCGLQNTVHVMPF